MAEPRAPVELRADAEHELLRPPLIYAPPSEPFLDVLYDDGDLLVVNKPSGLLSVPGRGAALADCIEARARQLFSGASIVHRLDMETSGVMVLARHIQAHRHISRQFERRVVGKTYVAQVWGVVGCDRGTVDEPLICDWPNRPRQIIDPINGREAQTAWCVLSRAANTSRVHLMPRTGRSHQLRVHMLSLGHPILGDRLYAHEAARLAAPRLQLHAQKLHLSHPADERALSFTSPCPF